MPTNGNGFIGVKSYVHKFYENRAADFDENLYESKLDEDVALTPLPKHPCAYSHKWKKSLYSGVIILFLGLVMIVLTHMIPLKNAIVGYRNGEPLVDQKAAFLDREIEIATLIGLSIVLIGGFVTSISILLPAFFKNEDEYPPDHVIRVPVNNIVYKRLSKTEEQIPFNGKIASVQPNAVAETNNSSTGEDNMHK